MPQTKEEKMRKDREYQKAKYAALKGDKPVRPKVKTLAANKSSLEGFRLCLFLQQEFRTMKACMELIGRTDRSISRQLKAMEQAGFYLERKKVDKQWHFKLYMEKQTIEQVKAKKQIPIENEKKQGDLEKLLTGKYLRRKVFVETLYGNYTQAAASKFKDKVNRYNTAFSQEERKVLLSKLSELSTLLDYLLY